MRFVDLLKLHKVYTPPTHLPIDCIALAQRLHLTVRNSYQCQLDFSSTNNPLTHNAAVYALYDSKYVIYYDELRPYSNFNVAREIAYHILSKLKINCNDRRIDICAALLIAPPSLILRNHIKSREQLSAQCQIPLHVAKLYWHCLKHVLFLHT